MLLDAVFFYMTQVSMDIAMTIKIPKYKKIGPIWTLYVKVIGPLTFPEINSLQMADLMHAVLY